MVSVSGKKKVLVAAAFIGAMLLFITNGLKLQHWFEVGFDFISYHPLLVFTSWAAWALLLIVFWATPAKEHWYIKLTAAMWGAMNIVFSYGIYVTYWA